MLLQLCDTPNVLQVTPNVPKTWVKTWKIILALFYIFFERYFGQQTTYFKFICWLNTGAILPFSYFHQSISLLIIAHWFNLSGFGRHWRCLFKFASETPGFFLALQPVLYKPSSNSSCWYLWSTCLFEGRTEVWRCFSPVSERPTNDGSIIASFFYLFLMLFLTSFVSLKRLRIACSVHRKHLIWTIGFETFYLHDELQFDIAHTHSTP